MQHPWKGLKPRHMMKFWAYQTKNLQAVVVAAVGYRSEEDATQKYKKIRKSDKELFDEI